MAKKIKTKSSTVKQTSNKNKIKKINALDNIPKTKADLTKLVKDLQKKLNNIKVNSIEPEIQTGNKKLQNTDAKYRVLFEQAAVGVAEIDSNSGKFIQINQRYCDILGMTKNEMTSTNFQNITHPDDLKTDLNYMKLLLKGDIKEFRMEKRYIKKDGMIIWVNLSVSPMWDPGQKPTHHIAVVEDITQRKFVEEKLIKSNRLYAVISQVNQMIVRTKDKEKLYEEVCRIAIEYGKFRMVWIGEVNPLTKDVVPLTFSGEENGYLKIINKISINNEPTGRGPTGKAIRKNKHFICNDIENDLDFLPWKEEALTRGYKSSAAFPITSLGKVIGSLNIYSSEVNFFDKEEIELLDEIVKDINYALEAIENENNRQIADDKLYESEVRYRLLHESMMDCFIQVDMAGKIKDVNKSYLDMLGYSRDEVLMLTYHDLTPSKWFEFEQRIVEEQILVKGYSDIYEKEYIRKDGTIFPVELRTYLLRDENGNPDGMWAIVRDITDRKQSNEKLKTSELKFKSLFENANDAIFLMSGNTFIDCNTKTEEIFGCTRQQILNHAPSEFSPQLQPDGSSSLEKASEKINAAYSGEPQLFEWQHIKYDKTPFDAEVSLNKIVIEGSEFLQAIVRDVTDRKKFESKLQESETKYRLLVENQSDLVVQVNADGEFTFISPSYCKVFGKKEDELIGKNFMPLVHEDDRELTRLSLESLKKPPHSSYHEQRAMTENGWRWLGWSNHAILDKNNKIESIVAIGRDITEQKNAEIALIESETKYREMVEQINDVIFTTDINGKFTYISPTIETLGGYKPEEMIGKSIVSFLEPSFLTKFKEQFNKVLNGNLEPSEYRAVNKSGDYRWIRISSKPIFSENNLIGLRGVLTDINDHKLAEQKIRENEEIFQQLLQNSPVYMFFKDENIRPIRLSKNYEQMLNMPLENILGKNMNELFPSELAESMVEDDKKILQKGELVKVDEEFDGRYYTTIKFPIKIEGKPTYLAGFTLDLTERVKAEKELKQKMDELERFNRLMVGRENKMVELKKEINELCGKLGLPQRYNPQG